jgi:hypothetical protein
MRKLVAPLGLAAIAMAVNVAPVAAQDKPVTKFVSKAKIKPMKAGTKRNPRGIQIIGSLRFNTITPGVEPPIVTGGTVFLPKHGRYNGGKYRKCGKRKLKRGGPRACPRKSIMGKGSGVAFADTVDAAPDVVFVNGGAKRVWAYTTLYNPALVQEPIAINVRRIRHRRWGYRVSFKVPQVLQVVAGVPITLRSFRYNIGRRPYARNYIVTTGCPRNKRYPYMAIASYLYNDNTTARSRTRSSVRCR